jgi:tellurite resistance protein TerA
MCGRAAAKQKVSIHPQVTPNEDPTAMHDVNTLTRGQKLRLSTLSSDSMLTVEVSAQAPAEVELDVACFGLDAADQLSDDRYFIFYNQKQSPCGAVAIVGDLKSGMGRFSLNLPRLPQTIRKLAVVMTLDGTKDMSCLGDCHFRLLAKGQEVVRFSLSGRDFAKEKAVILAEIYFKDEWRLAATGQGFNGGLSALLKHFGGQEKMEAAAPVSAPPPPLPAAPKVNIGKITLEKKGDKQTVDLRKGGGVQPIRVNLNWDNPGSRKGGLFASMQASPDLDLGCMYRLKNGDAGVIQPLGKSFGAHDRTPFIFLDKDDRSGAAADGENLTLFRPDLVDLVMVFAMVYRGATDFTHVAARLTLRDQGGNEIFMRLGSPDKKRNFCAICTIRNTGERVEITKEEQYFTGHREADQRFCFGFAWTAGSK